MKVGVMSNPDVSTISRLHHWFAVECNNQGWNLTVQEERSDAQDREMLQCAYAAAWHWSKVGEAVHQARADMLVAHAHAMLGHADLALACARRCLDYCKHQPCEPWDLSFAHAELALAASTAEQPGLAREQLELARLRGGEIVDPEDRKIFCTELQRIEAHLIF